MIRLELPWPSAKLNPNSSKGRHWGSTTALRAIARTEAWGLARQALGTASVGSGALALSLTFVQPDRRKRDLDNILAACKPALDGIADALQVNDQAFNPITIRREYGANPGCVIVEIQCRLIHQTRGLQKTRSLCEKQAHASTPSTKTVIKLDGIQKRGRSDIDTEN